MKRHDFERILEDDSHPSELAAYGRPECGIYQSEESFTRTRIEDIEDKLATLALMLYKTKGLSKEQLEQLYEVEEEEY